MTTPAVSSAAMGRAHFPGLWRVLDREANRLDHVCWADVTERGYGTLELTPDVGDRPWWFVHPYADDPSARAAPPAMAFRSELARMATAARSRASFRADRPGAGGSFMAPLPPRPG